ncbi:MAG TPA: amino acid adenylation domain-containing protein [Kofleriaceae bacterium]|nr:amino acid adenylation domain-containing protein [Kofleriaceae bacterium]
MPLSAAQLEIWLAHQFDRSNPSYNCGGYLEIAGVVDDTRLARAVQQAVEECEALRTRFAFTADGPRQWVVDAAAPLHRIDLRGEREPRRAAEDWMRADLSRPVPIASGELFSHALLRVGDSCCWFYFRHHHILFDGFGQILYWRRIAEIYTALETGRPPPPAGFASLAELLADEQHYRRSPQHDADLAYWEKAAAVAPAPVHLGSRTTGEVARHVLFRRVLLPGDAAGAVQRAATGHRTYWSVVALAAAGVYLHRLTQARDVVLGLPVGGRAGRRAMATPAMLANELPLRLQLAGDMTFADVVRQVSRQVGDVLRHQRYRGEDVQRQQRRLHGESQPPAVVVNVVSFDDSLRFGDRPAVIHPLSSGPVRDLQIELFGDAPGSAIEVCFKANAELYSAEALAAHHRRFVHLLDASTRAGGDVAIGQLSLVPEDEASWIRSALDGPVRDYDLSRCLHELVDARARRSPDAIAVETASASLTFAALVDAADRLAAELVRRGLRPGEPVGVHDVRSTELVISLLAVLKAGGAYLPLDPELPAARLAFQIQDAALRLVLSRSTHAAQLAGADAEVICVDTALPTLPEGAGGLTGRATPDSPAYVLYTSGSTGQPKGVVVPHRGIVNRLLWMQDEYGLSADDCVLQKTPFTFDVSGWELFWPLLVGCRMFLAEPGMHRDPRYLAAAIAERGVTTLHFVPPMLDLFLAEPSAARPGRLRRVFCSGEALRPETVRAFFDRHGAAAVELHNLYGPTEASIDVTYWPCRPGDAAGAIPIGRPVANTSLYVLDPQGEPVPAGAAGELYIGGVQVALGYLNRPELTAERFVASRFGGGRLYRTGDIARLRADGAIEYLGRTDDQVKIRGNRVELPEIESALLACPGIEQAAVIAPPDAAGHRHVLAYVVGAAGLDLSRVLEALRARLPGYMVPAHLIQLPALPISPSGKVDRKALPRPTEGDASAAAEPAPTGRAEPPASADEALVQQVWAQVLRIAAPSVTTSFFALGGDSMSAIQIRAELERHGVTFGIGQLFEGRSIRELAAVLRPVADAPDPGVKTAPFSLVSPRDRALLPPGLDDAYPLSAMQAAMLYHAAYREHSSLYRVVTSLRVTAPLDLDALRIAVVELARRHPSLRCSFDLTRYSEPLQLVHRQVAIPVELGDDLGGMSPEAQRRYMDAWIEQAKFTQFDVTAPPLLRFVVHPSGIGVFRLSVIEHHVVLDGWSDMRMLEEVIRRYRARRSGQELWLPDVPSTYRDFVAAERRTIASPASRDYWKALLRGAEATTLPRTQADRGHDIRRFDVPVAPAHAARLRALARAEGLPLKALLTAAHVAVLRAVGGRDEVVTGVIANARLEEAGGDDVIGVFLNTLPLRIDVGELSLLEAARRVFAAEHAALPHRGYPLAQMQRDLGEELQLETYVNFMDFHLDRARLAGDGMAFEAGVAETDYALAVDFLIDPDRDALVLWLDCNVGALATELCERLIGYYQRALAALAETPEAPVASLDLRGPDERAAIAQWNATARAYDQAATIPQLIARQAAATPLAVALVHGFAETRYAELDARANRLAHRLIDLGIGRGDLVGVSVRRSAELVVAMLGVMKAGAAYVPMDPAFPRSRLALIASDARIACLIRSEAEPGAEPTGDPAAGAPATTTDAAPPRVIDLAADAAALAALPASPPDVAVTSDDVAYVIYTSGSTGRPKGTAVRHGNVANFFAGMDDRVGCEARDVVVAVTSVSFDISALELLWPLTHGAKVVIAGEGLVNHLVPRPGGASRTCSFSLFFFAAASSRSNRAGYQLVLDAARFADRHGFEAVWTPERHFHAFGGLYPNPSVMAAALSTITSRVALRSGSVVAPLHDAVRLAEEWSVVDNLSQGRVGLAFASGWNSNDFVLAPSRFAARKRVMEDQLAELRRLWRGEPVRRVNGTGQEIDVQIFPPPVQAEPPIWLTSVGSIETFQRAGALGANVLTHLLGQRPADLEPKIRAYREARAAHGHDGPGRVSLMIHTFLGEDAGAAKQRARGPFRDYLRSSTELWRTLFAITGQEFPSNAAPEQLDAVVELAIERYFETSGLFGSADTCGELVRALAAAGVDELACLVDFGVDPAEVIESLTWVDELRRAHRDEVAEGQHSFTELCARHGVTLLQGTPSLMTAITAEPAALDALRGARALLVGGEAFPAGLAGRLTEALPSTRIVNMYGPTETTIWSTTHEIDRARDLHGTTISIGRPIANTVLQIMDRRGQPVPIGVPGELWIGGAGVAVGYVGQPGLTAERFVEYADQGRFYRTGDRTRWHGDGTVDFLGRMDRQVKILGHRVEPDEIESVLSRHPDVEAVAVVARSGAGGTELVAYVAPARTAVDSAIEDRHVQRWGELWQDTYAGAGAASGDPGDEFAGWISSYDGRPIPPAQMREWVDHTVARIRGFRPGEVADVGVGVGLILRELATTTRRYHGVDLSPAALARAAECLGRGRPLPSHVQLEQAGPEFLTRLPAAELDLVVLNSVVQYFPSIGYLRKVLGDAIRAVRPGGAVFVGDVRMIEMLPELHTAVQLHRATALQTVEDLRSAVARRLQDERELCVSPQFFRDLLDELPALGDVRIELKRGRADNELTQFRYDVSLIVGERPAPGRPATRFAFADSPGGLQGLADRLVRTASPLVVTGIPNLRTLRRTRAAELLRDMPGAATAWDLDRQLWELDDSRAVHPEDVLDLAARLGRQARIQVPSHGRLDAFDAVFLAQGASS